MTGSPKRDLLGVGDGSGGLVIDRRTDILFVVINVVERETAYPILDAEQILEFERDLVGLADQEQIVGDSAKTGTGRRNSVTRIPIAQLFARVIVEHLEACTGSLTTKLDQGTERVLDRRGNVGGEDDAPADIFQFFAGWGCERQRRAPRFAEFLQARDGPTPTRRCHRSSSA